MRLPDRYNFSNLMDNIQDLSLLFVEARRLALSANAAYSRWRGVDDPCKVMEEDWDTLVILDGCRYDLFERVNTLEGQLESRVSAGSESWEFLKENFQQRQLYDTVYVTANPHAPKLDQGVFHRMINLLESRWDEELKTVRPEAMTKAALEANEQYPDKRLIVHYMQPHFPFIGEKGRRITHTGVELDDEATSTNEKPNVWNGLRDGRLNADEEFVYEAYKENLELTLPHVRNLLDSLDGRSVVTSDHGNLVGERTGPVPVKGYGHPRGFYAPGLVTVPWLVVESENRRKITSEPPSERDGMDKDVIESRLNDLGYI